MIYVLSPTAKLYFIQLCNWQQTPGLQKPATADTNVRCIGVVLEEEGVYLTTPGPSLLHSPFQCAARFWVRQS